MDHDQHLAVVAWLNERKGFIRVKEVLLEVGATRTYNAAGEVTQTAEHNYGQSIRLILDTPLGEENVAIYISDKQANRISSPTPPETKKRRYPRAPQRYPEPVDTALNTCPHGIPIGEYCATCYTPEIR